MNKAKWVTHGCGIILSFALSLFILREFIYPTQLKGAWWIMLPIQGVIFFWIPVVFACITYISIILFIPLKDTSAYPRKGE